MEYVFWVLLLIVIIHNIHLQRMLRKLQEPFKTGDGVFIVPKGVNKITVKTQGGGGGGGSGVIRQFVNGKWVNGVTEYYE